MNAVHLFGKVVETPEVVRTREEERMLVVVKVATHKTWRSKSGKREERTDEHCVTCWGGAAEVAARDLRKGDLIAVDGEIHQQAYVDHQTGRLKRTTKITAVKIHLPDTDKFYEFFEQDEIQMADEGTSTLVPLKSVP